MFSVSPELFDVLSLAARYGFALLALLAVLRAFLSLLEETRGRRETLRNLPGSGTVGELVVLSGSSELQPETWIPVPREGVLGSVRTCDIVVPCPGVRKHHLDFSWQDGLGLLLRPRSGCEAWVNAVPVDCRSDSRNAPLTHGSCLTVGNAVLRLMVFAALEPASQVLSGRQDEPFPPAAAASGLSGPETMPGAWVSSVNEPTAPPEPARAQPVFPPPAPAPGPFPNPGTGPEISGARAPRPRRSDRWKEDWSE